MVYIVAEKLYGSDKVATSNGTVWRDDKGIIRYSVRDGAVEKLENAKEMIAAIKNLTGDAKHSTLIDIRKLKSTDKETRDYYASDEVRDAANGGACAILVSSPVTSMIGNMFIRVNKPSYPVKMFYSELKAVEWLKEIDE